MTEILNKAEKVALALMQPNCSVCTHGFQSKWKSYVVCDISGEKCLEDEICEDFDFSVERFRTTPINSGAEMIIGTCGKKSLE